MSSNDKGKKTSSKDVGGTSSSSFGGKKVGNSKVTGGKSSSKDAGGTLSSSSGGLKGENSEKKLVDTKYLETVIGFDSDDAKEVFKQLENAKYTKIKLLKSSTESLLLKSGVSPPYIGQILSWQKTSKEKRAGLSTGNYGKSFGGFDGVEVNGKYTNPRTEVINYILQSLITSAFFILAAPPAFGKTAILQLLVAQLPVYHCVIFRFMKDENAFEQFKEASGIDLKKRKIVGDFRLMQEKTKFILIDDAHKKYDDEEFWEQLIKGFPTWGSGYNYRFVISVTYNLAVGGSPVHFQGQPRFKDGAMSLLISNDEAKVLFDKYAKYQLNEESWIGMEQLKETVVADCGGRIGAITQVMSSLAVDKNKVAREHELLAGLLKNSVLNSLGRVFDTIKPRGAKDYLRQLFCSTSPVLFPLEEEDLMADADDDMQQILKLLIRSGVLFLRQDNTLEFSSSLAKRYYYCWLYPSRGLTDYVPVSVGALVEKVLETFNVKLLQDASKNRKMPKEAAFQQLFCKGLAAVLPPSNSICAELNSFGVSKSSGKQSVIGEIDFFVNGNLGYGLELLVNGGGIGEHVARFGPGGKYESLKPKDYAVVDFRIGKITKVKNFPKRISVFMDSDYSKCYISPSAFASNREIVFSS